MPEVWLHGPIDGVPPLLQPVAHALLQAREEARSALMGFPDERLWDRPAGVASVGFHLLHIRGVIDRLFTYARGESLSTGQVEELAAERKTPEPPPLMAHLLDALDAQVDRALDQLGQTDSAILTDARLVGRKKLPSTMLGLLFHAAEHTHRHVGQLIVTARLIKG
jgi:uncharacterized damage-inducible protein DinB